MIQLGSVDLVCIQLGKLNLILPSLVHVVKLRILLQLLSKCVVIILTVREHEATTEAEEIDKEKQSQDRGDGGDRKDCLCSAGSRAHLVESSLIELSVLVHAVVEEPELVHVGAPDSLEPVHLVSSLLAEVTNGAKDDDSKGGPSTEEGVWSLELWIVQETERAKEEDTDEDDDS